MLMSGLCALVGTYGCRGIWGYFLSGRHFASDGRATVSRGSFFDRAAGDRQR